MRSLPVVALLASAATLVSACADRSPTDPEDRGSFEVTAAVDVDTREVTIDFSTYGSGKVFDPDFYRSDGIVFPPERCGPTGCVNWFVGFVQGDAALVGGPFGGVKAIFTEPISDLSLLVAPAFQGTATYVLSVFSASGDFLATTSVTVTQDLGDPANSGFGYFTVSLTNLSEPAHTFTFDNVFVRSSFPSVTGIQYGVSVISFTTTLALDVPFFSQRADPWGPKEYNSASEWAPLLNPPAAPTIAWWGCLLASAAMVLRYHGITTLPACSDDACPELVGRDMDPLNLNAWLLKERGGFVNDGFIDLDAVAVLSANAGKPLDYRKFDGWDLDVIREEIESGRPVIIELDLRNIGITEGTHFVVGRGIMGASTVLLNDPDLRNAKTLDVYGPTHSSIRTFTPISTDLSVLFISVTPPLDFLVTDPEGRRTGFDPTTQSILADIPGAQYSFQAPLADDDETGVTNSAGAQEFRLQIPSPGVYAIDVRSEAVTEYQIATYTLDREANSFFTEPERMITSETPESYRLMYSPIPDVAVGFEWIVDIDIKPDSDPNTVNCTNTKGIIPVALLSTVVFDATMVDHETVTFGGARETHLDRRTGEARRHEEDVDGDGDLDLVFHFRFVDTGLGCDSSEGVVSGELFDGTRIVGMDSVRPVGR